MIICLTGCSQREIQDVNGDRDSDGDDFLEISSLTNNRLVM